MLGITSATRVFLKTGFSDGRLGIEGLRGPVNTTAAVRLSLVSVSSTDIVYGSVT